MRPPLKAYCGLKRSAGMYGLDPWSRGNAAVSQTALYFTPLDRIQASTKVSFFFLHSTGSEPGCGVVYMG